VGRLVGHAPLPKRRQRIADPSGQNALPCEHDPAGKIHSPEGAACVRCAFLAPFKNRPSAFLLAMDR
jgi:hypothetical protein